MAVIHINSIISDIIKSAIKSIKYDETRSQIEQVFRKHGFYTTKECYIYKLKDSSKRARRINPVARKGRFREQCNMAIIGL